MKEIPPVISWVNRGKKSLVVMYDKRNSEYVAGYSPFSPKLIFPKRTKCTGSSPEEALKSLQTYLDKNANSLPIVITEI